MNSTNILTDIILGIIVLLILGASIYMNFIYPKKAEKKEEQKKGDKKKR